MSWPQNVLVYAIECILQKDAYVGSTVQFPKIRWKDHLTLLNKEKEGTFHHSPKLQELWDTLGYAAFRFVELEWKVCANKKERLAFEAGWVEKLGTLNAMTVLKGLCNFSHSEETKVKQRKWTNENNPMHNSEVKLRHQASVNTPEYRALIAKKNKEGRWSRPGESERYRTLIRAYWSNEGNRKVQSEKLSKNNGMYKESCKINHAKAIKTPEYKKNQLEGIARVMATDEYKKNHKAGMAKPEAKQKFLRSIAESWSDPVRKTERLRKSSETRLKKRNLKSLTQAKVNVQACLDTVSKSGD